MIKDNNTPFGNAAERQLDQIIEAMQAELRGNEAVIAVYMDRVEPVNMFYSLGIVKSILSNLGRLNAVDEEVGSSLEVLFGAIAKDLIISHARERRTWSDPPDTHSQQLLVAFQHVLHAVMNLTAGD